MSALDYGEFDPHSNMSFADVNWKSMTPDDLHESMYNSIHFLETHAKFPNSLRWLMDQTVSTLEFLIKGFNVLVNGNDADEEAQDFLVLCCLIAKKDNCRKKLTTSFLQEASEILATAIAAIIFYKKGELEIVDLGDEKILNDTMTLRRKKKPKNKSKEK